LALAKFDDNHPAFSAVDPSANRGWNFNAALSEINSIW
jgi:hypothetical protein